LVNAGNPYGFYLHIMERIAEENLNGRGLAKAWALSEKDIVYQSFIRNFATLNGERGTALKQIGFLPFLRDRLGVTVFVSLPTGTVGSTSRKGSIGSPFAIKNPFDIDQSFSDPLLPDFSPLFQYKALVQACTMLGIAPGSIVPLATLAVDSPLFALFPDLGFWWVAEPGDILYSGSNPANPDCTRERRDTWRVADTPPDIANSFKSLFVPPPAVSDVRSCDYNGQRYYRARIADGNRTCMIGLANSFPDIVAGDAASYTWSDVATLNYTSAICPTPLGVRNTARYDPSKPAWHLASLMLAWRACELGERVFLVDVSSNVPDEVLLGAEQLIRSWHECAPLAKALTVSHPGDVSATEIRRRLYTETTRTAVTERLPIQRRIYFIAEELWDFHTQNAAADALVGPLVFCVAAHTHNQDVLVDSLRFHLKLFESQRSRTLFFAGVSNHDTVPPLPEMSPLLYVVFCLLPGGVPMIFSGAEYHSQLLTNKEFGLNTTPELLAKQRELKDHSLGLFNHHPLDWRALPRHDRHGRPVIGIPELLAGLTRIRRRISLSDLSGFRVMEFVDEGRQTNCFGFVRFAPEREDTKLVICVNWDAAAICNFRWTLPSARTLLAVNNPHFSEVVISGSILTIHPHSAVILGMGDFFDSNY